MSDGFLSRWSRRKRGEEADSAAPAPAPVAPPETVETVEPEAAEGGAEAAEAVLSPEELAELPPLDELTAETDLTAFLRAGVPRALRNAALRRAWALDPKVRDFVCEAREYAYDWNVPGGVPGNGDLLPTDDVPGMLRRIFADRSPEQADGSEPAEAATVEATSCDPVSQTDNGDAATDADETEREPAGDRAAAQQDRLGSAVNEPGSAELEEGSVGSSLLPPPSHLAASQPERVAASPPAGLAKRRHGRAAPI